MSDTQTNPENDDDLIESHIAEQSENEEDPSAQESMTSDDNTTADLENKKINPLFSDDAEDDEYDYDDLDDEESRMVWYFAAFFIIVICTGVIILAATVAQDSEKIQIRIPEGMEPTIINGKRAPADTPMILPPLISPVIRLGDDANLSDSERVIGVIVGDKHRAYLTNAFSELGGKVVNDMIDQVPISVTYCDIYERARVFTSTKRGDFLSIHLGGWMEKEMFFYYEDEDFKHSAEETPLPDYPYVVTTWGDWRGKHPDTDIYMGGGIISDLDD